MKHKFTLGVISGIAGLSLAVPILAQISSAQSSSSSATAPTTKMFMRKMDTSVESIQAMIEHDDALLTNIDAMVTVLKNATQTHKTALTAATSITDDTARADAVKKAHDDLRTTIDAAIQANPDLKGAMPFGGMGMQGPGHGGMRGPHMEQLSTKLGMTNEELKAAIASGKTIEDIAKEKGIDLPVHPMFKGHMFRGSKDTTTVQ